MRCFASLHRYFLLLAALGSVAPVSFSQESPKLSHDVLTLSQSLDRALKGNPQLLIAQKEFSVTKTELKQAKSLFYPTVNLGLNYIRYRNETLGVTPPDFGGLILEAPIADSAGKRGNPLAENLYVGRLGFRQTLYSGGRIVATYKLSQANVSRSESALESLRQNIQYKTSCGFYSLLALGQKQDLIDKGIHELDGIETKGVSHIDQHDRLLLMQVKAGLRQQLSDVRNSYQKTLFDYLEAMGAELFTDVGVQGSLEIPPIKASLQETLAWAKENRPELKQTQLQEEVDQLAVHLAMAERYPVFLLGGGYELRNNDFPLTESNWNAGLSMNIPLFDGFSSLAQIKRSRYKAEQGRYERVQLEDRIEKEVRSAFAGVEHWVSELVVRRKEQADFHAARQRFAKRGNSSFSRERVDYLQWVLAADLAVIDAQVQVCMAAAQLEKAMGRSLFE